MGKQIRKFRVELVQESANTYDISTKRIDSSYKAPIILRELLNIASWHNEKLGFVALNTQNDVIGLHIISEGTISETACYPREIATRLLLNNAKSCILFHNHPANSMKPSQADINTTRTVKQALETLDIKLVDHVILSASDNYFSFAEQGMM